MGLWGCVMYKIAVVEDEEKQVQKIKKYLHQYEKENMVDFDLTFFSDGDEIVEKYDCSYDLILMDIMMQFMDGMTAAEEIRKKDETVMIIFTTNMVNFAIKGYQVGAFDYILKPITYFQLEKSISRALKKLNKEDTTTYINIGSNSNTQRLALKEILYIESYAHYLTFYTIRGEFTVYMRLKDVEDALEGKKFFRISKSIIVNFRYVDGVVQGFCVIGKNKLPVSRSKKKEFMEQLTYYMYNHS